jgi:Flp pilus assembly pilin Flp
MNIRSKRGQAMAEYIIIVVVVALAALAIFGVFSDTLRAKLGGATEQLGGNQSDVSSATSQKSQDFLKGLQPSGN